MSRTLFSAATFILLPVSRAVACPLCRSDTGRQVRDGIFSNEFGGTLLAMILPFLVITAVVGLIYNGPPWGSHAHAESSDERRGPAEHDEPH